MFKHLLTVLLCILPFATSNHEHSQIGFISIDCGFEGSDSYADETNQIIYTSDANFTDAGVSRTIAPGHQTVNLKQQLVNVRSFTDGARNCYTLKPQQGKNTKYLIRATFMYGNYDGASNIPTAFDLLLDADVWDTVNIADASTVETKEIMHLPQGNYVHVCLVNTGGGTPFISSLELRPLKNDTYETQSGSLLLDQRLDIGSLTNESVRYPDDIYDRIWQPFSIDRWESISTTLEVESSIYNDFNPPHVVMKTAIVPLNNFSYGLTWEPKDATSKNYIYFYIAEVVKLQVNQTREFNIFEGEDLWYGPINPGYLKTITYYSMSGTSGSSIHLSINKTDNSTLPPILNAFELYVAKEFLTLLTDEDDVDSIASIKSQYAVKKNWQGDPCVPKSYLWEGLGCSDTEQEPPRIILLNLSSSGLGGAISPYISGLTELQTLDLSNNSLTGPMPSFLTHLQFLKVLNLKGNNLTGSIPAELTAKAKSGLLSLSVDDNLCQSDSCEKNKGNGERNEANDKKDKTTTVLLFAIAALLLL